ncbi:MAG: hypothetical protein M1828_004335 [Chrysothrix sp. TS-e1954]|nr:MAG: hypothetical protein M1828_004335 [Chrysothrix sp. TS-e1954]
MAIMSKPAGAIFSFSLLALPAFFFALNVQAKIYPTRFDNVTWDNTNWRIQTTYPDQGHYQSRGSLANGYVGINVASLGPFFEVDVPVNGDNVYGWPLFDRRQTFATVAGFYDVQPTTNGTNFEWLNQYGGESVISGVPHWAGLVLEYNGNALNASTDPAQISDFVSTLDLKAAELSWNMTWTPPGGPAMMVQYAMFVHKLYVNRAAVQMSVTAAQNATVTVSDVLDGDCAVRTHYKGSGSGQRGATIWSAVQPADIPNVTAYVYSTMVGDATLDDATRRVDTLGQGYAGENASSIAQRATLKLQAGSQATVSKYIGIASNDAFANPQSLASSESAAGAKAGYNEMFQSHTAEWAKILTQDSVDDYTNPTTGMLPDDPNIVEHQITSVTNPYFLLQNTIGKNAISMAQNNAKLAVNSIAVSGLGSSSYAGLIFWDVEVWMAPGLVVAHPNAARQIANYRAEKYEQAKANVKTAYSSSQVNTSFSPDAAIYPWTSGRFGNCTGTGPCFDYEYHINGDIGIELENFYIVSGDAKTFHDLYFPLYDSIAQVYSDLLFMNKTSQLYGLSNATDPDEYANHVDNAAYTIELIGQTLNTSNAFRSQFGIAPNTTWSTQAASLDVPTDYNADVILEYKGMNGTISVKQADVVLIDDFLHYQNQYTLSDLDYYAGKQTNNGPAMTYGVFSIIASANSPSGCADYTYDLYGSQPYVRAPFFQFSEQLVDDYTTNGGTHPAFPFLTGIGGALRVAVFGYLGLKLQLSSFNINPSLPPQITHLNFRTLYWQGHAINATANTTHTTLSRIPQPLDAANTTYLDAPIPVTVAYDPTIHNLTFASPLVLPNRQTGLVKTTPGNVAQCLSVTSPDPYLPGQFPLSAVDGATSTVWQPQYANQTSSITVTLGDAGLVPVTGLMFNWAAQPPRSFSVQFFNSSDPSTSDIVNVTSSDKVSISQPFDASRAALVEKYVGNMTNITLTKAVFGGRYARLHVRGNQNTTSDDGVGATVAEWAIVGGAT